MKSDFILSIFIPFAILLEALAAFSSIIFIKKYKSSWYLLISFLLCYSFLSDFVGVYVYNFGNNTIVYNIVAFVTFLLYLILYNKTFETKQYKFISQLGILVVLSSYMIESFIFGITTKSLLYSYIIGGSILILTIVLFFLEKLQKNGPLQIKSDLLFWISVGLLLFYVGYLPIKITRAFFANADDLFNILKIVQLLLVMIMNICFTLGFIWAKKKP